MLDTGDVFDKMAFLALTPKDLISTLAQELTKRWVPGLPDYLPARSRVEKAIDELRARYGGRLGGMTRKNLIAEVNKEIVRIFKRRARDEGKTLYLTRVRTRA